MKTPTYLCTKCNTPKPHNDFHESPSQNGRPVTFHCKECRKERDRFSEIFNRQLKKYKNLCKECQFPRKFIKHRICAKCFKKRGIKQCNKCKSLLLMELNFYKGKAICITCYNKPKENG